ncbi:MAG: hypothetical protein NT062_01135, partial [Proteobacteria bacterium]|nr:hypothetical protein [Pseudomonadota bacterium]
MADPTNCRRASTPFPFAQLRRLTRADAAFESACARWLAVRGQGTSLATLVQGPVDVTLVGIVGVASPTPTLPATRVIAPAARARRPSSGEAPAIDPDAHTVPSGRERHIDPFDPFDHFDHFDHFDPFDSFAAVAEVRIGGVHVLVVGEGGAIRTLAQRLLGGPVELAAPRPLTTVEHAIFALVIASALEDAGVRGDV